MADPTHAGDPVSPPVRSILLATGNPGKARELAELVADLHTILLRRAVEALG